MTSCACFRCAQVGRNRPLQEEGSPGTSTEVTMVFEYWLGAIAIGEMLLLSSLLRPERS